jgi:preprotein translocase subunit YajC
MLEFLQNLGPSGQMLITVLIYAIIIGGMYLVLLRPQQKKKKQEEEMRKSIGIGDEVITIGGIIGKIISVKDDNDSIVVESGNNKIRFKRWAISGLVSEAKFNLTQK